MKIPGHTKRAHIEPSRRDATDHARSDKDDTSRVSSVGAPAARVKMSEAARSARAPEAPDMAKVERLRDAIANGELKVDTQRIASRILEEEL